MKSWWRESLTLAKLRRATPLGLAGSAALMGGGGCIDFNEPVVPDQNVAQRAEEFDQNVRALALQENEGWDVGGVDRPLALAGASPTDAYGSHAWRVEEADLYARLQPRRDALLPYYVPTLFQSLVGPGSERLQAQLRPIHTAQMDDDYGRGLAVRELFEQAGWPLDTAIVVDAPGPRAVAIAAALSDHFDPVFTFANWPHPLGVVPAQETLAASLFYLPIFEATRPARPVGAPPLFVLDSNRLLPYRDADTQFDNRYLARLPSPTQLKALGINHVLYVNSDGQPETDDLNRALVELCGAGVDVKVMALADFQRGPAPAVASAEESEPIAEEGDEPEPAFEVDWFWYGGFPEWQVAFWEDYGWYHPLPGIWVGSSHHRRCITVGPPTVARKQTSGAHTRAIAARPSLFHAVGMRTAVVPPGFGEITVRSSRADGTITAVRAGGYQPHYSAGSRAASGGGWVGGARSSGASGHWGFSGGGRSGSLGRVGGGGFSS